MLYSYVTMEIMTLHSMKTTGGFYSNNTSIIYNIRKSSKQRAAIIITRLTLLLWYVKTFTVQTD